MLSVAVVVASAVSSPIIGGYGDFRFEYDPEKLALPPGTELLNAHGLVIDPTDGSLILTYEPVHQLQRGREVNEDQHCMIKWKPDGTGGSTIGPGTELCAGVPHGLRLSIEDGKPFLYHANNAATLHKTRLDGSIVWSIHGPPTKSKDFLPNKPTWFAAPPDSEYVYMADGYGSNYVHVYQRNGTYTGVSFGGRGTGPGKFQTCHSINWDTRSRQLVVSDRENHRHQYFRMNSNQSNPEVMYASEFAVPELQRPCNLRVAADGVHAVVAALEGPVGVLNESNALVSLVDVAGLLGDKGHLHPHNALLMPSGDLIVATWNPGKLSYWKRI